MRPWIMAETCKRPHCTPRGFTPSHPWGGMGRATPTPPTTHGPYLPPNHRRKGVNATPARLSTCRTGERWEGQAGNLLTTGRHRPHSAPSACFLFPNVGDALRMAAHTTHTKGA